LVDVVERLMQKAPDSRFGSAGEVVEALKPLATGSGNGLLPRVSSKKDSSGYLPRVKANTPRPNLAETPKTLPTAKSASPSTPTPRPQNIRTLPSRDLLRRPKPTPPAPPAKSEPSADADQRVIPGGAVE